MLFERRQMISLRIVALTLGDAACVVGSVIAAAYLRLGLEQAFLYLEANTVPLFIFMAVVLLVFYIGGMYERQAMAQKHGVMLPALLCTIASVALIILIFYAKFELLIGRGVLLLAALFIFVSSYFLRIAYRAVAGYSFFVKNALVVGEGKDAASIIRLFHQAGETNYRFQGVVTDTKGTVGDLLESVPVIGQIPSLRDLVKYYRIETLIVATSMAREPKLLKVLRPLRYAGLEILDYASFYEQIAQEIPLDHIDDEWLLHAAMNSSRIHIRKLKRIMDVSVAVIGLLLSAPICALVTVAIWIDSRGPLFYRQRRSGLDGVEYTVLKFRTMVADAEATSGAVWAGKNDIRITRVGGFLRKSRIDEIPQLLNVLRGEMSLVGPRPERPEFIEDLARQIPFYQERLLVPPGITGWAQVRYPYAASIEASRRKLQLDLYYIKHMSLFLDVTILLRTFKTILVGLRHSEDESVSMEEARKDMATQLKILQNEESNSNTRSA